MMRFLIDADLPRSVSDVLRAHGHEAVDVRDIGMRSARDQDIGDYAQREHLCLITGDFDFADVRSYPPERYAGIVVLTLPRAANTAYILRLLDGLLDQEELVAGLVGKLAIAEPGRVRVRGG